LIIAYLFTFFAIIQLSYWLLLFVRILGASKRSNASFQPKVSVIVVFKNERENLKKLIPLVLHQDYPNFGLVLCDDFSEDGSLDLVKSFDDPRVNAIKATKDLPGKKFALHEAVHTAEGTIILVTDADCFPGSNFWISSMINHLQEKEILLGYSPHLKSPGFLNKFIRFETYMTALQYMAYALAKIPYMGVGRNLMYTKELFAESSALQKSTKLISGDDDLLVNAIAHKNNTTVNLDPKSFMFTQPEKSWGGFYRQKRRHVSASVAYKFHHQILLALFSISHFALYISLALACFTVFPMSCLAGMAILTIIKWIIAAATMKRLACKDLVYYFPLLDFFMACYYVVMAPSTIFKTKNW